MSVNDAGDTGNGLDAPTMRLPPCGWRSPSVPPQLACVVEPSTVPRELTPSGAVEGPVLEVGSAIGDCNLTSGWYFVLAGDGGSVRVSVSAWAVPLVRVGEKVSVEWRYSPGYQNEYISSLTARHGDGTLLFWIGVNATAIPGELSFSKGAAACEGTDYCGRRWLGNALEVALDGTSATVAPGRTALLGRYYVDVLSTDEDVVGNGQCGNEWGSSTTALTVYRSGEPVEAGAPPKDGTPPESGATDARAVRDAGPG